MSLSVFACALVWIGFVCVGWTNGTNERRIESGDGLVVGMGYTLLMCRRTEQEGEVI